MNFTERQLFIASDHLMPVSFSKKGSLTFSVRFFVNWIVPLAAVDRGMPQRACANAVEWRPSAAAVAAAEGSEAESAFFEKTTTKYSVFESLVHRGFNKFSPGKSLLKPLWTSYSNTVYCPAMIGRAESTRWDSGVVVSAAEMIN